MQAGSTGFSETYNPLALTTATAVVDRSEQRPDPAGRARLHLPDRRLRDQPARSCRTASASPASRTSIPNIKRMYNIEDQRQRSARTVAARLGVRRLVPSRFQEPAPPRQQSAVVLGLHAVHAVQPIDGTPITYYNVSSAARDARVEPRPDRRQRPQDLVQRLRVQLQCQAAARASRMFGGGMSERTIATTVRRALESEPAPLLRPDQERHPVPDPVQDRGHGAREVRRPGELLVPEPAGLSLRHDRPQHGRRHLRADRSAQRQHNLATPNGAGTVWLITPTTRYTSCPGNSACAGLRGRRRSSTRG